jgi:hypothetical protein
METGLQFITYFLQLVTQLGVLVTCTAWRPCGWYSFASSNKMNYNPQTKKL